MRIRGLVLRTVSPLLCLAALNATLQAAPLVCPSGTPLGRIELTVVPAGGGVGLSVQTVNRVLPGERISYRPVDLASPANKDARVSLILVPADGSKLFVSDPAPAGQATSWQVPFRTELASLVWGPNGLNKAKVSNLVAKDSGLIGQLADYAAKTAETQALLQAIAQQQTLDTGESVDAAVAGFATRYSPARIDRTQPINVQLGALLHGVNPALAAYDPLAQNPQQQAAQTAGLVAAVAGLFLGNGAGLAATGGAALVNLHSVLFPRTQFLSALAQPESPATADAGSAPLHIASLCGGNKPAAAHTELAFLWAMRFPDAPAPDFALPVGRHLAIGVKSTLPLEVDSPDWKLAARVQDWCLVSAGNSTTVPVPVKVNTTAKTIELDLTKAKLKPGSWKLAGSWDWDRIEVSGSVELHDLTRLTSARLSPASQDKLIAGAGPVDLDLTGDDFEFVRKIQFKKQGDPWAQPQSVTLQPSPAPAPEGPRTSLKLRLDATPLKPGNYVFLIAQADDKPQEAPFKVLPAMPALTGTPLVLNTGLDSQSVTLHGSGLDRIESLAADNARITLGDPGPGDSRVVTVQLAPAAKPGTLLALRMKVKDVTEPISADDAFLIAGPRPAITTVRQSPQAGLGIALNPGEMASNTTVSFELGIIHAAAPSEVDLSCADSAGPPAVKAKLGDAKDDLKLTQESSGSLYLLFRPDAIGRPGCTVTAELLTPNNRQSEERKLGVIVLLPQLDSFEVTDQKAGNASYVATLEGRDLETIAKVGWDATNGVPVDSIPTPVPGQGNKENLRVAVPWPAPAPHAPLYIWLRGEERGRLTTSRD